MMQTTAKNALYTIATICFGVAELTSMSFDSHVMVIWSLSEKYTISNVMNAAPNRASKAYRIGLSLLNDFLAPSFKPKW